VATIKDLIADEVAKLRMEGGQLLDKANKLESKAESIPEELHALADETGAKVWGWLKGVI